MLLKLNSLLHQFKFDGMNMINFYVIVKLNIYILTKEVRIFHVCCFSYKISEGMFIIQYLITTKIKISNILILLLNEETILYYSNI